MSYSDLNSVYRNLDIFNFPEYIPLMKQIQSVRALYTMRRKYQHTLKMYPTEAKLKDRIIQISTDIFKENNSQTIHELMDAVIELEVTLPTTLSTTREGRQQTDIDAAFVREQGRLLGQYRNKKRPDDIFTLKNITEDKQNVHHSSINDHVKKVVIALCDNFPNQMSLWGLMSSELQKRSSWNTKNQKSLAFIRENTSVFTDNHISLKQLAISIFMFIMHRENTEEKEELFTRFNQELSDMQGTCSTGHLSRLINVVQGFSDKYTIQMDPEKEMKSFIFQHLTKLLRTAPEHIQEGILEKTTEYRDYLHDTRKINFFKEKFGKNHETFIERCILEYIEG